MELRIKEIIKRKGLTQKELADRMNISLSAVKQMLNASSVTTATLDKIAAAVGCEATDFFIYTSKPPQFTALVRNGSDTYAFDEFEDLRKWVDGQEKAKKI